MNTKTRQILVLVTAVVQVGINVLIGSGIVDFNLPSTEAIADSLPNYFTPAGYTFLVWNVIFLGVIAYAIYQLLPGQSDRAIHQRIGGWVIAANIGNGAWSLVWGAGGVKGSPDFQPAFHMLSGVIMIGILFSLTMIFIHVRNMHSQFDTRDKWLIQAPYSAFFAWINIAAVANFTAILIALDIGTGEAGEYWSVIMIGVSTILVCALLFITRGLIGTIIFAIVVVWAFIGVAVGNQDQSNLVPIAAFIGVIVVILVAFSRRNAVSSATNEALSIPSS